MSIIVVRRGLQGNKGKTGLAAPETIAVANNLAAIQAVADNIDDVHTVADGLVDVNYIKDNLTAINNVSSNIAAVVSVGSNIAEVIAAPTYAANAEASEIAAAASAASAAAIATSLAGTSTTSLSIATGSKTFTTQAGKQWILGQRIRAASDDGSKAMEGPITSYATTSLTINVDYIEGSGVHADWNIGITGPRGVAGAAGATGAAGAAGVDGADGFSSAGFKNKLINGDFRVWQRSTNYALTATLAYGGPDRWAARQAGTANGYVTRSTFDAGSGFRYSAKIGRNVGAVTTGDISFTQVLETTNSIPLAGRVCTLSFFAKKGANFSAASSSLKFKLVYGTGTDQTTASYIAGTWTGITTLINSNVGLTTSGTRYNYSIFVPAGVTQLATEFFYTPVGTAGADDSFSITGIQLEEDTMSSFDDRGQTMEEALCLRYCLAISSSGLHSPFGNGQAGSATASYIDLHLTQRFRSVGGFSLTPSTLSDFQLWTATTGFATVTSMAIYHYSDFMVTINASVASGLAAGNATSLRGLNSNAKLILDAEL